MLTCLQFFLSCQDQADLLAPTEYKEGKEIPNI